MTKTIIAIAILEGVAILSAISVLMTGLLWPFGVVGALLLFMAMQFPSQSTLDNFVEGQMQMMDLEP